MFCTLYLHILKKSFTITEVIRRIFHFTFQMHIQYLHTFVGSQMTPIQKSVSSDCMEGMADIETHTSSIRCLIQVPCINTQKISNTFEKHFQNQLNFRFKLEIFHRSISVLNVVLHFMEQETISAQLCVRPMTDLV